MQSHPHSCAHPVSLFKVSAPICLYILNMYFILYGHHVSQTLGSYGDMGAEVRYSAKKDTGDETQVFSHAHSYMEPTASNFCSCIWLLPVFSSSCLMNNHCPYRLKNLLR
uniref:Prlr protein n=1 Tax=Mus musculus TaxID=10090 RepID=Q4VA18_MOUSE|nr:Prlr protein [Mus musculus]